MAFVEEVRKHKFSILRAAALVFAIVVVGSATLDVYVETMAERGLTGDAAPGGPSLVLNQTSEEAGTRILTVEKASANLTWGDLKMVVSGTELAYGTNASRSGTYCVSNGEDACSPADAYADSRVNAGDEVHVHHANLTGKTLRVVDRGSNAIIANVHF